MEQTEQQKNNKISLTLTSMLVALLLIMTPSFSYGSLSGITNISFDFVNQTSSGFSHYINTFREFIGLEKVKRTASISQDNNTLRLVGFGFKNTFSEDNEFGVTQVGVNEAETPGVVRGETLVYPNPFKMSGDGGVIYYDLSKNMEIEIQVYDMMANMIIKKTCLKGTQDCAQAGRNLVHINESVFNNELLSAGVYFYLLLHHGEVLAKGKMAIVP